MIILPQTIYVHEEEARCPKCEKIENIKSICGHCGHEYPADEDAGGWLSVIAAVALFLLAVWLIVTIAVWMFAATSYHAPTLWDLLVAQWQFLAGLRLW